jgi:hypothetical protein
VCELEWKARHERVRQAKKKIEELKDRIKAER